MAGVAVVTLAVEGDSDRAAAVRILETLGFEAGPVHGLRGKPWLMQHLPGYNNAARFAPWLVLVDLNGDAHCAPEFTTRVLSSPAPHMHLRVAVRAVEAWLLADVERLARFLGVSESRCPPDPDALDNPKRTLVDLARHARRAIREDMVPAPGTSIAVGPGYTGRIIEFAAAHWRPVVAARHSDSLARCLRALREWRL